MKALRYIMLLAILGLAMYGIITVDLAFQKWVYLLATVYIATLVWQALQEQKKTLAIFYSIVGVIAFILFILGFVS